MIEVHAYVNDGSGFSIPDGVYAGLEALWIEDFAGDQVTNPKFAVEALADQVGPSSGAHVIFVALDTDAGAVGTCFARQKVDSWILDGAFVMENRREEKIFSAIMEKVKHVAGLCGIAQLIVDPNKRAPRYWRSALGRWGFTVKEEDSNRYVYADGESS